MCFQEGLQRKGVFDALPDEIPRRALKSTPPQFLNSRPGLTTAAIACDALVASYLRDGGAAPGARLSALVVHLQKVPDLAVDLRSHPGTQLINSPSHHRWSHLQQTPFLSFGERPLLAEGVYTGFE